MSQDAELFKETLWERLFIHYNYFSQDELMETAIHEAGNCLIGEILYPMSVNRVAISAVPTIGMLIAGKYLEVVRNTTLALKGNKRRVRYRAGVYGGTEIDEEVFEHEYFNKAMIATAGGLAVCNILSQHSATGCDEDIACVKNSISRILEQEGFKSNYDAGSRYNEIETEIQIKTNIILAQNQSKLMKLAKELVKKKRLTGNEVRKIIAEN